MIRLSMIAMLLVGCAAEPRSTRMTVGDFNEMTDAMAASLLRNEAVARRSGDSDPWLVVIDRVVNLTEDVMTRDEQWAIISMVRGATPIEELRRSRNIRFVVEPGPTRDVSKLPSGATHTMTATFRDIARTATGARSDLYYCEFEILDLRTGEPVWIDKFEFKRAAEGNLWD